jgi:8-oxo-dGTP pyrophosphatase MutT (NUDIX family)
MSAQLPISIKGIVLEDGKVWLRKNERDEWELPGGKLDEGEQSPQTVIRELKEELGFDVEVIDIIQADIYLIQKSPDESRGVLVITYLCKFLDKTGNFEFNGEAGKAEFQGFALDEIEKLTMPRFYKDAIGIARRKELDINGK